MAINRWIGQAVAVQETRHYIPRNVSAGSRFQLADGVKRLNYSYPVVTPEGDVTTEDKARRVVEALVALANGDGTGGLSGGTSAEFTYSVASYNGSPAIRVDGTDDGSPIGIVESATGPTTNPVLVQQMQVGSAGADYIFTLTWPTVPTSGQWALAADGKAPLVLAYNVLAADLKIAIDTFGLPCASVAVTGSHSAGYTINLVAPTKSIAYPPLLFPIVPPTGSAATITMVMYESRSYRFGPDTSGYDADDGVFDADITATDLKARLTSPNRLGAAHAGNTTIVMTALPEINLHVAGVTATFTFSTLEAYHAFISMQKVAFDYTWQRMVWNGATSAYELATSYYARIHQKIKQFPKFKVGSPQNLNPLRRAYHTRKWSAGNVSNVYMFDVGATGYDSVLSRKLVNTNTSTGSDTAFTYKSAVTLSFTDGLLTAWSLTNEEVEVWHGYTDPLGGSLWNYTIVSNGAGNELGVNNNAGYKVTTVGTPGIISQEMLLDSLDGNIDTLYRFKYDGKYSNYFNGTAGITMIQDAAQALWGAANVKASKGPAGKSARMVFTGALAEMVIAATVENADGTTLALTVDIDAATPMQPWVLRYQFTGGVCSGYWKFVDAISPVTTQSQIQWLTATAATPASLLTAIQALSSTFASLLRESDITVVTEAVGTKFILREFTVSFAAQPTAAFFTAETPSCWFGLDTSTLKTAEPLLAITSEGLVARQEVQLVSLKNGATSGNWTLTYNSVATVSLAYNATAAAVQAAIITVSTGTDNTGLVLMQNGTPLALQNGTSLELQLDMAACTVIGGDGGPYRIIWTAKATRYLMVGVSGTLAGTANPSFDTVTAAGTGANHWDNADNWSLGTVPAADAVVFKDGSVPCKFGLATSAALVSIDIYRSYSGEGSIGLPEVRADGSLETLPRWLELTGAGSALPIRIGLGEAGEGPKYIRIDATSRAFNANVLYTQTGLDNKCCALKGSNTANTMIVSAGDVALGVRPEDTATMLTLKVTPSESAGDEVSFSSSSASDLKGLFMSGGTADLGDPPETIVMLGGSVSINGTGDTKSIDAISSRVRWLADGTLSPGQAATAVLFGALFATSTPSGTPLAVRITKASHGLASGQKVYMRAYSGVYGIDGRVYAVNVIDASNFDLIGSSAYGTLTGYTGLVSFALASQIIIRQGSVLDFDSEGRTRDIVPPIIIQGSGFVSDSRSTITDLRIWAEQVEALAYLGQSIELRRSIR